MEKFLAVVLPALAFTEPGGGSDLMALRTTATRTQEGTRLNGAKTFISNGPIADVFLVAAVRSDYANLRRQERSRGIGVYPVIRGAPGLSAGPHLRKLGMRSSETCELAFEDVLVPSGTALSTGDSRAGRSGFHSMMALLDFNRLYIAALSVGLGQAAFEACLPYVKERTAFDVPIGRHQATGFKLARMSTLLDASRALIEAGCRAYDGGEPATRLVSEAKLFATEAAVKITSDAVQVFGGHGYMEEHPVERYFRDARVGPIWEGTSEIQHQIICRELGMYE